MEGIAAAMVDAGIETSLFSIRDELGKKKLTSKVWARALGEGDELAEQLFEMAIETLGIGVASVINTLDVERVIVGGGLAEKLGQSLADRIEAAAKPGAPEPAGGALPLAVSADISAPFGEHDPRGARRAGGAGSLPRRRQCRVEDLLAAGGTLPAVGGAP